MEMSIHAAVPDDDDAFNDVFEEGVDIDDLDDAIDDGEVVGEEEEKDEEGDEKGGSDEGGDAEEEGDDEEEKRERSEEEAVVFDGYDVDEGPPPTTEGDEGW